MALSSLSERMARTKRHQARARAGERGPAPEEAANDATERFALHEVPRARDGLLLEFENLLPSVARHYGYETADIDYIRACVTAVTPAGHAELALCVRQWRIDAITHNLDGLPEGAARRAWIQFRQSVMGHVTDEMGVPYGDDALDCPVEAPAASDAPMARQ